MTYGSLAVDRFLEVEPLTDREQGSGQKHVFTRTLLTTHRCSCSGGKNASSTTWPTLTQALDRKTCRREKGAPRPRGEVRDDDRDEKGEDNDRSKQIEEKHEKSIPRGDVLCRLKVFLGDVHN